MCIRDRYNPLIISGLAYGIDSIAHKKSLTLSLPTVGVLGHGLDIMYPAPNRSLAEKMLHSGGLLTEFPSQTKPDKENFPMRNRIIAALSDVIVVIESRKKGGSIITAELANDYNKDVFAVPGRLNDDLSEGCNNLIKQNKAHLIESADDIGYIMRWEEMDTRKFIQTSLFVELDETEKEVVNLLKQEQELTIDQITYRLRKQPSEVSSLMVNMEFKSVVRCLPGKKYILSVSYTHLRAHETVLDLVCRLLLEKKNTQNKKKKKNKQEKINKKKNKEQEYIKKV